MPITAFVLLDRAIHDASSSNFRRDVSVQHGPYKMVVSVALVCLTNVAMVWSLLHIA